MISSSVRTTETRRKFKPRQTGFGTLLTFVSWTLIWDGQLGIQPCCCLSPNQPFSLPFVQKGGGEDKCTQLFRKNRWCQQVPLLITSKPDRRMRGYEGSKEKKKGKFSKREIMQEYWKLLFLSGGARKAIHRKFYSLTAATFFFK